MRCRRFHININDELNKRSEESQRFYFNSSEVNLGSKRSQRFGFNSSKVKQHTERN